MKNTAPKRVHTFTGIGAQGNPHHVHFDIDLSEKALLDLSRAHVDVIQVYVCAEDECSYYIRFYAKGREIMFCGSGVLAAAKIIFDASASQHQQKKWSFHLKQRVVQVSRVGGMHQMVAEADLPMKPAKKAALEALVGKKIRNALCLGGVSGYWLVELESACDVKSAHPNLNFMKRHGGPALIITSGASNSYKEDYVMRYFAPQFGSEEDAATGSANVYLMQYWQKILQKKYLAGRQLSKEGGLFYGKVFGHSVALRGRAEIAN